MNYSNKAVLQRQRNRIAESNEPLLLEDSTDMGNKYTHASWGMCSREAKEEFNGIGIDSINHSYKLAAIPCPMRKKNQEKGQWGCFYECRLFKGPRLKKDEVLELYDRMIINEN